MTTRTFYAAPYTFVRSLAFAREILDFPEDDFDMSGLAEGLSNAEGFNATEAELREDEWYDVLDATDWRIEIETHDGPLEILPLPWPGSWYDPALDPSNAPARTPDPSEGVVVILTPDEAGLLRDWLRHQEARPVVRSAAMTAAIAALRGQLTPW